jgi:hypothetical protein
MPITQRIDKYIYIFFSALALYILIIISWSLLTEQYSIHLLNNKLNSWLRIPSEITLLIVVLHIVIIL